MTTQEEIKKKILVPASKLPTIARKEKLKERNDFKESVQWRIFRIMAEFVDGFEFLSDFKKSVTFFGSARIKPDSPYYQEAEKLSAMLAKDGFAVFSGGGPGIMEAANKGAYEAGGESVGLNIQLKYAQRINNFIKKAMGFHYFFTRKVMLSYSAQAYVFFPGGFGTLDEFFEILVLIQTEKIPRYIPIVCVGKEFWRSIDEWIKEVNFGKYKFIDKEDIGFYHVVDSVEEAFEIIKKSKPRGDINY